MLSKSKKIINGDVTRTMDIAHLEYASHQIQDLFRIVTWVATSNENEILTPAHYVSLHYPNDEKG